jgi:hypothetical protein
MWLEILREFCPAIGNTEVISAHFQLPVLFCLILVLVGWYSSEYYGLSTLYDP